MMTNRRQSSPRAAETNAATARLLSGDEPSTVISMDINLGKLPPESYLRVVANPFLALFAILIAWALPRIAGGSRLPEGVLIAVWLGAFFSLPWLVQFHCLDCGKTGRLTRWRSHLCSYAAERRLAGKPRKFRGPKPTAQVFLWLLLFAGTAAALLA